MDQHAGEYALSMLCFGMKIKIKIDNACVPYGVSQEALQSL
jgi:hypothetical protein